MSFQRKGETHSGEIIDNFGEYWLGLTKCAYMQDGRHETGKREVKLEYAKQIDPHYSFRSTIRQDISGDIEVSPPVENWRSMSTLGVNLTSAWQHLAESLGDNTFLNHDLVLYAKDVLSKVLKLEAVEMKGV